MKVAAVAREREIIDVICAAVLSGNDMLDVMEEVAVLLVQPAILAPFSGPLSDEPPNSGTDH